MSLAHPWLPPLIFQAEYGDFEAFLDAAYGFFSEDFILSNPSFCDKIVKSERHVAYEGKDHSFWHCIEERTKGEPRSEDNRVPKLSLCERIRWPRPVIENAMKDPGVHAWLEAYHGRGKRERVHLWLKDEDYVLVLDPRGKEEGSGSPKYYILWTTYLIESERMRAAMEKRCEKGRKIY